MPELTTSPRMDCSPASVSRLTVTEGDTMLLLVNTPAAAQGVSDSSIPTSILSSE